MYGRVIPADPARDEWMNFLLEIPLCRVAIKHNLIGQSNMLIYNKSD
jgi:hypothetical protein